MARIDTISVGRQSVRQLNVGRVDDDAFGAGVGRAISNLAEQGAKTVETFSKIQQDLAAEAAAKENGARRAEAYQVLTAYKGERTRELMELQQSMTGTAEGFTNTFSNGLTEAQNEAMKQIHPDLHDEFLGRFSEVNESLTTTAFKGELAQKDSYIRDSIDSGMASTLLAIRTNNETVSDAISIMEDLIHQSGLPESDKQLMIESYNRDITKAALARDTKLEADAKAAHSRARRDQSRGLSKEARRAATLGRGEFAWDTAPTLAKRMLGTISSVESPGYNIMYTPDGQKLRTFEDFSAHPNQGAVISSGPNKGKISTAAGKYQFIYDTWIEAKNALGLTDFSPESQDRAAWWLAKRDYRIKTGRELESDLATLDPAIIAPIRNVLKTTWEGFGKMTDEEFLGTFMAGISEVDGRDLLSDPEYASLTPEERMATILSEEAAVAKSQAAAAAALERERSQAAEQFLSRAAAGEYTLEQAMEAFEARILRPEDVTKVEQIYKEQIKEQEAQQAAVEKYTDENYVFTGSKEDRDIISRLLPPETLQGIRENDSEAFGAVLSIFNRTSLVPGNIQIALRRKLNSSNFDDVQYALSAYEAMSAIDPDPVKKLLSAKDEERLLFWKNSRDQFTPEELQRRLDTTSDPALADAHDKLRKEATRRLSSTSSTAITLSDEAIIDAFDTFSGSDLVPDFVETPIEGVASLFTELEIGDRPLLPESTYALEAVKAEYRSIFVEQYALYKGDIDQATEATNELIKRNWSATTIGGRKKVAKTPPEVTRYPKRNGTYRWIEEQARTELKIPGDRKFELIGDNVTAEEHKLNLQNPDAPLPSYLISVEQPDGTYEPVWGDDGKPYRIAFEYNEALKHLDSSELRLEGARHRLNRLETEARNKMGNSLVPEEDQQELAAAVKEAAQEVFELQQQVENAQTAYENGDK